MSTRSRIGIEHSGGSVESVYCHYDGYPDGVGATLEESYQNREKVEELIALGDLSYLGPTTEPTDTMAYTRDRGDSEDITRPKLDTDHEAYARSDASGWVDWLYLFTDNGWRISKAGSRIWADLPQAIRDYS